jgi:hypothetical protein
MNQKGNPMNTDTTQDQAVTQAANGDAESALALANSLREKRANTIGINLDCARMTIRDMESLIRDVQNRFELVLGTTVYRFSDPPCCIRDAYARMLCAGNYVASIDRNDDSEANLHRSWRAMTVCNLLEASVKALLVPAYIILAQKHPGFGQYKVFAEQASAYARQTLGGNWEYFVPKILLWEDHELPEECRREAIMLCQYAELAFNYAKTLDQQTKVLRYIPHRREQFYAEPAEPQRIERDEESAYYFAGCLTPPAAYELPRAYPFDNREIYKTRKDAETNWGAHVYDEARENAHYRIGGKWSHDGEPPKDRITGFARRRGGAAARKRRQAIRAANLS